MLKLRNLDEIASNAKKNYEIRSEAFGELYEIFGTVLPFTDKDVLEANMLFRRRNPYGMKIRDERIRDKSRDYLSVKYLLWAFATGFDIYSIYINHLQNLFN